MTTTTNGTRTPPLDTLTKPRSCSPEEWATLNEVTQEMPVDMIADLLRSCLFSACHRAYRDRSNSAEFEKASRAAIALNSALAELDFLHDADQVPNYLTLLNSREYYRDR